MTVDTRENGKILPELPAERVIIRINSSTLIFPKREKVKNKEEYIRKYNAARLNDTKRHG